MTTSVSTMMKRRQSCKMASIFSLDGWKLFLTIVAVSGVAMGCHGFVLPSGCCNVDLCGEIHHCFYYQKQILPISRWQILPRQHRRGLRRNLFQKRSVHWLSIFKSNDSDKGIHVTILQSGAFYLAILQGGKPAIHPVGVSRESFSRKWLEIQRVAFRDNPVFEGMWVQF